MPDIFKKVAPYLLYEPQQQLLDAIGPQYIIKRETWQSAFHCRLIKEPIELNLTKFDFDEKTTLEEKIKRVFAFFQNDINALPTCHDHASDAHLQALANNQLKFLTSIWQNQTGYTQDRAFAAIKTLISIEIAYFFLEKLKETNEPLPLKEHYQENLQSLIQAKFKAFQKNYPPHSWLESVSRYIKNTWDKLQTTYHKSYFKQDLNLILHCGNLWQQNIPYSTFFRNLSWVSLRLFRLCALAFPTLLFYITLEIIPSYRLFLPLLGLYKKYLAPILIPILSERIFQISWHFLEKGTLWSLSLCSLSAIFVGFPWFSLLASMQGLNLLLGTSLTAMKVTSLSTFMFGLTQIAGPLMWIGIPIGLFGAASLFIGAGLLGGVVMPLKRLLLKEKLPALDTLKKEVLEANNHYFREVVADPSDNVYLSYYVYLESKYQVCFTQEEINTIRRKAVLSRFDILNDEFVDFLQEKFTKLNTFCAENQWYAREEVDHFIQAPHVQFYFRFQRNQNFDTFKEAIAEGIAKRSVQIKEEPIPRL